MQYTEPAARCALQYEGLYDSELPSILKPCPRLCPTKAQASALELNIQSTGGTNRSTHERRSTRCYGVSAFDNTRHLIHRSHKLTMTTPAQNPRPRVPDMLLHRALVGSAIPKYEKRPLWLYSVADRMCAPSFDWRAHFLTACF